MAQQFPLPHAFWHPIRRRRFVSALIVILALRLFPLLDARGQQRVDDELVKVFQRGASTPWTAWREIVGESNDNVAILRGVAMARLNIPTGIPDLAWSTFVPHSWLRKPLLALSSFRRYDKVTDEAADFLRSKGVILAEPVDYGIRWMNAIRRRYP